jgi:hypothetical protein
MHPRLRSFLLENLRTTSIGDISSRPPGILGHVEVYLYIYVCVCVCVCCHRQVLESPESCRYFKVFKKVESEELELARDMSQFMYVLYKIEYVVQISNIHIYLNVCMNTCSSTLSCLFQQTERDKAEVSTSRGGTGARCVRP